MKKEITMDWGTYSDELIQEYVAGYYKGLSMGSEPESKNNENQGENNAA
jgi:hypothetical protein